jgi:protein-S-isoprenylcysteine O-methyltransferase Ste14
LINLFSRDALVRKYPGVDFFSHDAGHLLHTLLGWKMNPHFDPLHILSNILILCGFILLSAAWKVLYEAQRTGTLAVSGPYAYVRHPQYGGFILIMLGFLLQWPTLVTLIMFPILVTMYVKLAHREEREVLAEFGETYRRYMASTPPFFPRLDRGGRTKEA